MASKGRRKVSRKSIGVPEPGVNIKNELQTGNSSPTLPSYTTLTRNDDFIKIKVAKQHNFDLDYLEIPKHNLVFISGFSGSGKSSLAFAFIFSDVPRHTM